MKTLFCKTVLVSVVVGLFMSIGHHSTAQGPDAIVIATWKVPNSTMAAWQVLQAGGTSLEAVEAGCRQRQDEKGGTGASVGWGGSPDENGETTQDAMIMDGLTHRAGAVAGLRRVKDVVGVARAVMEYTKHTLLVGDQATTFAREMGFPEEDIHSNRSWQAWSNWRIRNCQPNFRQNVTPDPSTSCGPYSPNVTNSGLHDNSMSQPIRDDIDSTNHDTIGVVALDLHGNMACATSTNGAGRKVPGRVGDSPIPGSGSYVDNVSGGCAATGNGDIMMRFLPCYLSVELMRQGYTPAHAAQVAIAHIRAVEPSTSAGLVVLGKDGQHGAACNGMNTFPYTVQSINAVEPQVVRVNCSLEPPTEPSTQPPTEPPASSAWMNTASCMLLLLSVTGLVVLNMHQLITGHKWTK